jgi:hypothetical protein
MSTTRSIQFVVQWSEFLAANPGVPGSLSPSEDK